jgi:hypothetical protein
MELAAFHKICVDATRYAVRESGRIGNLVVSVDRRGESLIREPEMIHAFAQALDEEGKRYGIKVPTGGRYRFVDQVGERTMRARHDLVIFGEAGPEVLVELKRNQPASKGEDYPRISKDLRKLLLEEAGGKAMFHICHASNAGTVPAVARKYVAAFSLASASVEAADAEHTSAESWFVFYILVLYDRNDDQKAVLRHFAAPTPAALREAMPGLTIDQFQRQVISRD